VAGIGSDKFLDLTHTVDGPPAEPVEAMIALGFPARDQAVDRGTVLTKLTMFMTGPESAHAYRVASGFAFSSTGEVRTEMVLNGRYQGSAPSLKGISGGGIWQVSLRGEMQPDESPALAAMIIEQPQTYRTAIRSFIRKFDTNA
jgi:hypothetical protein